MIEKLVNWITWAKHKLAGHLLVTILTPEGQDYTFYASSIYTENGFLVVDDLESGIPLRLRSGWDNITVTGV